MYINEDITVVVFDNVEFHDLVSHMLPILEAQILLYREVTHFHGFFI